MDNLTIALGQINTLVGDIPGNTERVLEVANRALQERAADVILFPELTLTGYPPEDLLLRPSLQLRVDKALAELTGARLPLAIVVGYPKVVSGRVFNMAGVIADGVLVAEYAKQHLPNYQVFDEVRYFVAGDLPCVFDLKGIPTALTICEDIWQTEPMTQARAAGAKLMLNLNASPYHQGKSGEREALLATRAQEGDMPIVYTNLVGGQDELVFDGGSMVVSQSGQVCLRSAAFAEALDYCVITRTSNAIAIAPQEPIEPHMSHLSAVYQALVLGLQDYVEKNGFRGVVLGLSGGIDSALTLAIAVDALGSDRVEAVMMPFRYTSDMSKDDAADEATRLGVRYQSISIEPMYDTFMAALADEFAGTDIDTTEQNLQARCRGVVLMALSNKKGLLVLTTGNKSELAVGYSTLYGDMAGGFDVLKDVPKTQVFALARYRNDVAPVIPENVITRPPSAELAPDQKDEDSLPPYDVLDQILAMYIERDYSAQQIVAQGFAEEAVNKVIRLVDINEYKRRQSPIGPRITTRGFGRDRRYPITSGWKAGE
ncbi:NAD+ synthase [Gilvimarinus sp. SDUM040013]|uniref:Glutamine-dependent NAD(+) synthetase n=1 Tax=Gilvimarinus gilvus TaxID=3058038 RepID=A0ABU4S192_9GAMM|nr:NAD+ synthase [Gilvimarinus sp. SDUM040013]MDO3384876.1 NAD+ synthase [Gilvimarinus sp. SDUM040013]MDX6850699.1 NAD+ synthase [Gilvimarinus sp. SDUM040013]